MAENGSAAYRKLHADLASAVKAVTAAEKAVAVAQKETAAERKRAAEIVRKAEANEREKLDRLYTALGKKQYLEAQLAVQGNGQAKEAPIVPADAEPEAVPEEPRGQSGWSRQPAGGR